MSQFDEYDDLNYKSKNKIALNEHFLRVVDPARIQELSQTWMQYWPEQSTRPQQSELELQKDVKMLVQKLRLLEATVSLQSSLIQELEFKINSTPFEKNIDEILNYVTKTFTKLSFVTEMHYRPLEDGTLKLIVIHNGEDRIKALELAHDKFLNVKHIFPKVVFQFLLLHLDEVLQGQMMGTIPILPKI